MMTKPRTSALSFNPADAIPERPGPPQPFVQQAEQLDAADGDGHHDRDRGDREIVVELAHRLHEGPAVGVEHQRAVGRVDQRHGRGEQRREDQHGPERQAVRGLAGRQAEQRDLRRRVEAQAEQEAEQQHVPGPRDQGEQRPAQARQHAAVRSASARRRLAAPSRTRRKVRQVARKMTRLTIAIANRKSAETSVPISPPISRHLRASSPSAALASASATTERHDGRMPEREEQARRSATGAPPASACA